MSDEKKSRALGINHVVLEVGDLDAALEFYGAIFDFKLRGKSDHNAFIDLGDQFIQLALGKTQGPDDKRHFGFVVDDRAFAQEWKPPSWPRDDPSESYLAEVGALSLNENCVEIRIAPEFGRTVMFRCSDHSWHGHPTPVADGHVRRSLAAYFYDMDDVPSGPGHSTVWRDDGC